MDQKTRELIQYLETEGYFNLRVLPDGDVIGCVNMIFTVGVVLGLDRHGYDTRICYPNRTLAIAACNRLQHIDDAPLPGYTAIK